MLCNAEVNISILRCRDIVLEPNETGQQHEAEIQRMICIQKGAVWCMNTNVVRWVRLTHLVITVPEVTALMDTYSSQIAVRYPF